MKNFLAILFFALLFSNETEAQFTRYIIKFKDKNSSPYSLSNPLAYLSQRAVDRRTKYGIAIDSTDLPVNPSYITQIKNVANVTLLNISKWQNAVTIKTTDPAALTTINNFSFVKNVNSIAARNVDSGLQANKFEKEDLNATVPPSANRIATDYYNYGGASYNEIHLHNGEFLHNIGLRGQGMQIAMLDNGFNNYLSLKAFDSVNNENRVLGTWDFVANEANVANDGSHGMSCMSTICANIPGQFIGKAPKASFWLYQTEDNASEYPIEEFNWVCGAERADSTGADVISSSLGYYDFDDASFNYTYAQMNGHTTIAVIGANNAAKKGMLVFLANGNEGGNAWHYLITPADADSILAVGAVNVLGAVGGFSSYGPAADGRVKPEVASIGVGSVIQSTGNTVVTGNGTSYACPNMAGLGTILWQAFPEFNNMKIRTAILQASSQYTTPDDRKGYGIPNMKTAFANLMIDYATSSATINSCTATINWNSKDVSAMRYEIERKLPADANYTKIADVPALPGTQLAPHAYTVNNAIISPSAGMVSYRIRQVIDTNAASFTAVYIDTASVNISTGCFATGTGGGTQIQEKVSVQPNPISGSIASLIIETPYAVSNMPVLIYDNKGSLIKSMKSSKTTGKKTLDINVSRFSKGSYYIKVWNSTKPIGTVELIVL